MLQPDHTEVRRARDFVQRRCEAADVDLDTVDTALLLASEVVTNAFLHGRSEARLVVAATPEGVRVEVSDDNSRHPVIAPADTAALDGRGMTLVSVLATTWGTRSDDLGKTVWFTVTSTVA